MAFTGVPVNTTQLSYKINRMGESVLPTPVTLEEIPQC